MSNRNNNFKGLSREFIQKEEICWYWYKDNKYGCKFGEKCKYKHYFTKDIQQHFETLKNNNNNQIKPDFPETLNNNNNNNEKKNKRK